MNLICRRGMTILPRPAHPTPPRFSLLYKDGGVGMGKYFVPAPWGRDGFSIFIPTLSLPRPHPAIIKTIIVNLVNSKSLIFKVEHKTWDKIFFILIPTAALWPFSLLYTCFSSFKYCHKPISQTPLQHCFLGSSHSLSSLLF